MLLFRLWLADICLIWLTCMTAINCQQNPIFGQSTFPRRQQQAQVPQLRQQLQLQQQARQQGLFPQANPLNPLSPLSTATPLNTITPITPIVASNPFRYNQYNQQNYVPITAYQNELNLDGSFSYGYSSADGTTAQAQGYVKNLGYGDAVEAQVIQGSYSYTSPEGTPITVRYIADENGFRAEGTHIPTPPQFYGGIQQSYQAGILNPNLNPYQTPYRQFTSPGGPYRPGQQQLTPLQLQQQQQQQQQQRKLQQQSSGQYQPDQQFNTPLHTGNLPAQYAGQFAGFGNSLTQQGQQNLTQQQQLQLQQQQQQQQQQQGQPQGQQRQQQDQQNDQRQELRGRPSQLVDPFGYNQYRRFKKSPNK